MTENDDSLRPGMLAPGFSLPAHNGQRVTLSEFQGEQHVVLFFMREFS